MPERRKKDGANRGAIGATWHVARANVQTFAKKTFDRAAGVTNEPIGLKLCGICGNCVGIATIRGQNLFGEVMVVPSGLIDSFIAPERLARSGPERCH